MSDNSNSNVTSCIGGCCGIILALGVIGGVIALLVFDILALKAINPAEVYDECHDSAMWWYILVTIIMMFLGGSSTAASKDKENAGLINNGLVSIVMFIWGCIEVWGVDCVDELKHELLYKMALTHVIIGIVGCGIFTLVGIGMFCGAVCKS